MVSVRCSILNSITEKSHWKQIIKFCLLAVDVECFCPCMLEISRAWHVLPVVQRVSLLLTVLLSQVGGGLSVLPLSGLSHGHVDALQPLLSMFLVLSFQHVCLAVCEDLKGPRQAPITSLFGYHLRIKRKTDEKEVKKKANVNLNICSERDTRWDWCGLAFFPITVNIQSACFVSVICLL